MKNVLENIVIKEIAPFISLYKKGRTNIISNRARCAFTLSISGTRTFTMNEKTFVCNPTTAIVIPQGSTYQIQDLTDGSHYMVEFTCDSLNADEILEFPLQNPQSCHQRLETLMNKHFYSQNRLREMAAFYEVLYAISSIPPVHRTLNIITKYIEKNISNPHLTNDLLAEQGSISEVYMRRLFTKHHRTTPKQYVLDVRLRTAELLLTQSTLNVTEIAEHCGFTSANHFCRAFKNKVHMTPTEYAGLRKTQPM